MSTLGAQRYVSLTTFRRDGKAVATPVWVVGEDKLLFVWTAAGTGKVKRIRNNPQVTVAPCDFRGRSTDSPVSATARIVPHEDLPDVWKKFRAKYNWQLWATLVSHRLGRWVTFRRYIPSQVFLELVIE